MIIDYQYFTTFWYYIIMNTSLSSLVDRVLTADQLVLERFLSLDLHPRQWWQTVMTWRCVGIVGLRWVGKTTYLLHQRQTIADSLYISCDMVQLTASDVVDIVMTLYKTRGISTFLLDEVHAIADRDGALKNIYDLLPVDIIFSGSSMIDLTRGTYDLSRRALMVHAPVFSLREYVQLTRGYEWPVLSLDDVLHHHQDIARDLSHQYDHQFLRDYFRIGQFWFRYDQWSLPIYQQQLNHAIRKIITQDVINFADIKAPHLTNVLRVFSYLCQWWWTNELSPHALGRKIGIHHQTVARYIEMLSQAGVVNVLSFEWNLSDSLRKSHKVYPHATNMQYLWWDDVWYARESFMVSALMTATRHLMEQQYAIRYQSQTDIVLTIGGEKYFLEIGGANKKRTDVLVVSDEVIVGSDTVIPLWLFGLLW